MMGLYDMRYREGARTDYFFEKKRKNQNKGRITWIGTFVCVLFFIHNPEGQILCDDGTRE